MESGKSTFFTARTLRRPDNTGILKETALWNIATCSVVEIQRRLRGECCLHHQDEKDANMP
jgi:hypothetical protein